MPSGTPLRLWPARGLLALILLAGVAGRREALGQEVHVSEIMALNGGTIRDEDGDPSDWIELQSTDDVTVDLDGWYLTDDARDLTKWRFPAVRLEPGATLLVFASGKGRADPEGELHTSFRLDQDGEYVGLIRPDGSTVAFDFPAGYPPLDQDVSFGISAASDRRSLVAPESTVRYLVPRDGSLGAAWRGGDEGFDDAAWSEGAQGLGYHAGGEEGLPGLVAAWTFETSEGTPVEDGQPADGQVDEVSSHPGGPYHGIGTGGLYSADVPELSLHSRRSLELQEGGGVESFEIDMPRVLADLTLGDFTIHLWFKTRDTGRAIFMGSCCSTLPGALNFELHTSDRLRVWIAGPGGTTDLNLSTTGIGPSRDGRWHSAAAVRRGAEVTLYFEGEEVGSTADVAGSFSQTPAVYYFGRDDRTGDTRFDGHLDDVAFWNRALEPAEIEQLAGGLPLGGSEAFRTRIGTDVADELRGVGTSLFLRAPFTVDDPEAIQTLRLRTRYADGHIAWINGQEVARAGAPAGAAWDATALSARSIAEALAPEEVLIEGAVGLLTPGDNVLAIQALNADPDDDAFLIEAELVASNVGVDTSALRYFPRPTPGEANRDGVLGFLAPPVFSVDRGFRDEPFDVEVWTPTAGATVRYTLDGSWPGPDHGEEVTGPIRIEGTATLRAVSLREGFEPAYSTHSYIFLDDVLRQPSRPEGFPATWQPGVTADYAMDESVVDHDLHRDSIREDLRAIPTVSIVMDPPDLFEQPRGIYANSNARGLQWERRASVELFDPHRPEREFHVNCAIRHHGGASRNPPSSVKHNFRLIFSDSFGIREEPTWGPTKLEFPLFEDSPVDRFDNLVLRAGYNYSYLHGSSEQNRRAQYIRCHWMRYTQLATGHLSARNDWVHLYLNGLYWGIYAIQERPDASFQAQHLGGDKREYDSLNANDPTGGDWIRDDDWNELIRLAGANLTLDANYERVVSRIDVDNLIDYMILHIYGGTTDWPVGPAGKNYWQGKRRGDGGVWRFYTWDAEYSLQGVADNRVNVSDLNTPPYLYSRLRTHPEFRLRFADRVHRHFFNDGALTPARNIARYRRLADRIDRAIVGESARWGDRRRAGRAYLRDPEWLAELEWMTGTYMVQRHDVVLSQFRGARLYTTVDAPTFVPHGGPLEDGLRLRITGPEGGVVYYRTDGGDPRLPGGAIAPEARVASSIPDSTTLVDEGAEARILVPQDGSLALRWTELGFDDTGWRSGRMGVGLERSSGFEDHIVTDLEEDLYGIHPGVYLRLPFEVTSSSAARYLALDMRYDDGYVAYINGVRVVARNAPEEPAWDSTATDSHLDSEAVEFERVDLTSELEALRSGPNVLAIHGLNRRATSGDMLISARLVVSDEEFGVGLERTGPVLARTLEGGDWSALTEATFVADTSALRISEVMYHPFAPRGPSQWEDDDFEFIELVNTGDRDLNLAGVRIEGGIRFEFPRSEDGPSGDLRPGEYVILVRSLEAFTERYDPSDLRVAGEYDGRLANGGEELRLIDALGRVLLDFAYDDAWSEPTDGGGFSLEVIEPTGPPGLWDWPGSWRASEVLGGTPGSGPVPTGGGQVPGDINQDGEFNISDPIGLLAYLFVSVERPLPCGDGTLAEEGNLRLLDFGGDGSVNLSDAVGGLRFLFHGGSPPALGTECRRIPDCPRVCR